MSMSFKASPDGTYGEILVNGQVVAKLPVSGNAVIPGLVGTVSQSGGVPTGAVVERGSNANGEYVRFADGTQICFLSAASGSVDSTVTFPATFSEAATPQVSAARVGSTTSIHFAMFAGLTPSSIQMGVYSQSFARATSIVIHVTVIGRWF